MTLRTQYSSKEIEVLESYSHRLNNKVHISFPGGTFGDMVWVSIFVTNTLPIEYFPYEHYGSVYKDIYELCLITPEGRVEPPTFLTDSVNYALKTSDEVIEYIETRHDILFAVYMRVNESTRRDTIHKFDDNEDNTIIDAVISHCCDHRNPDTMSLFETEFNQKLIIILPNDSDAEFYGEICSNKTDINKECDWFFTPNVKNIKKNITNNTLVINPNRFVIDEEVYTECVKEILEFSEMKVDTNTMNKMISYWTFWYNKQPKYILDYDFKI
jgi:hypothetical protein